MNLELQNKTQEIIGRIMDGDMPADEIKAYLTNLHNRGETIDEIIGASLALRARASKIKAPENALDCCGTGGDGAHSLNISTAVAIVAGACGVPIAKHGGRAASSKCGAGDVLEELGVNLSASKEIQEKALEEIGFAFLFAQNHHKAMKNVAPIRKALGFRTIFNLLGPLANPAGAKFQLLGVFDKKWCVPMASVLRELGAKAAWVVHGDEGLDEISISGKTHVAILKNGQIEEKAITPKDFGLPAHEPAKLKGADAAYNASALKDLLCGKKSAYRDCVLANTAACLVIAGLSENLNGGALKAARAIDCGAAKKVLENYARATNS